MRRARVAPDRPVPSLTHRGRAMPQESAVVVGLDTSKMKISVALAEEGRQGEVRFLGDIDHTPEAVRRLVTKLAGKYGQLLFCYEAGPTGYGLQRQICALGHDCGRDNWLSSRVFGSYTDLVDHCCYAWNRLIDQPWIIMSIGLRDWANA